MNKMSAVEVAIILTLIDAPRRFSCVMDGLSRRPPFGPTYTWSQLNRRRPAKRVSQQTRGG
jgi:hypothetical protein